VLNKKKFKHEPVVSFVHLCWDSIQPNSGVIVSMLTLSVLDNGFKSNQNLKIGICCFSAKHVALRSKSNN